MNKKWHVWTIVQQRNKKVEEFLTGLLDIDKYLYPTVVREYDTVHGKKSKNIPLYNNYIFIKYNHTEEISAKISKCQWIKDYVGICSSEEIKEIEKLSKKRYEDIIPSSTIKVGSVYKLMDTPFKGMTCTVVEILGDKLVVSVELFGSARLIKCSIDDIYLEG